MENIVYILGAGFSKPFGIPTMIEFYQKSEEMQRRDPEKYEHFTKLYERVRDIGIIAQYMNLDLNNIEHLLSIFEMTDILEGNTDASLMINYICDVINNYDINIPIYGEHWPSNWHAFLFGKHTGDSLYMLYGYFICSLMNITIRPIKVKDRFNDFRIIKNNNDYRYTVITLNYDLILDKYIEYISSNYNPDALPDLLEIIKLHGSVENRNLIMPTWNKLHLDDKKEEWIKAYNMLKDASHIRIIGYSLPNYDSHLKFLFASGICKSKYSKQIDIICMDKSGSVEKNYKGLFKGNNIQFKNGNVIDYFKTISKNLFINQNTFEPLVFDSLEKSHVEYMKA